LIIGICTPERFVEDVTSADDRIYHQCTTVRVALELIVAAADIRTADLGAAAVRTLATTGGSRVGITDMHCGTANPVDDGGRRAHGGAYVACWRSESAGDADGTHEEEDRAEKA